MKDILGTMGNALYIRRKATYERQGMGERTASAMAYEDMRASWVTMEPMLWDSQYDYMTILARELKRIAA